MSTNPSSTIVAGWLAEISSFVDIALAAQGITTPITDGDITPALNSLVNQLTADMCHNANGTGRFFTQRAIEYGVNPMKAINGDVKAWVADNLAGLVAMGAQRPTTDASRATFRDVDERGVETFPLFQRDSYAPGWRNADSA